MMPTLSAALVEFGLYALSCVYAVINFCRDLLFKLGILKTHKLDHPVISVGNITVGGSGKTALVLEILRRWPDLCVLTRGYKSGITRSKKFPAVVSDSSNPNLYGDEPSLIKKKFPDTAVIIDPQRSRGATLALDQNLPVRGFLLDDGYQHRYLHRDLNILLLDVDNLIKKPHLIPLGRFRESLSAMKRADYILLTKWNHHGQRALSRITSLIEDYNIPFEFLESKITAVINHKNEPLTSENVVLITGLGQPMIFEKDFRKHHPQGLIHAHLKFSDHYKFKLKDLKKALKIAKQADCKIVCSEKDYVKLSAYGLDLDDLYYTVQSLELSKDLDNKIKILVERD